MEEELPTRELISLHIKRKQLAHSGLEEWQLSPELPTPEELKGPDRANLRENDTSCPYESKMDYLETQYQLCRVEGTELLRRTVIRNMQNPNIGEDHNSYKYTQVHVQGYTLSKMGLACRIAFSTEQSQTTIDWPNSPRLKPGTMVVLSPKKYGFSRKFFVASVIARPVLGGLLPDTNEAEDTPPRVDILWSNPKDAILDPSVEMVMLESNGGYFESVRHCMIGLQHAALEKTKFDKYIIEGCTDGSAAEYLEKPGVFTPPKVKSFDESQHHAFNRMTTQELAIVQGPPGTGKTFTSVVALESLVETLSAFEGSPIIVAAQTNHALDQILSSCMGGFGADIARLGGRSQEAHIEERSLFNLRMNSKLGYSREESQYRNAAERTWKALCTRVRDALNMCFPSDNSGLISPDVFKREGVMTQKQYESLLNPGNEFADKRDAENEPEPMERWLDLNAKKERPEDDPSEKPDDPSLNSNSRFEQDERERLRGTFIPVKRSNIFPSNSNAMHHRASKQLHSRSDLYDIKPQLRAAVYDYMCQKLIDKATMSFPSIFAEYQTCCQDLTVARLERSAKVLRFEKVRIIGCTTTGLAKYRGLISAMRPKVLLIEEAAETREANITSALLPCLDQVILVGDHQQLVPHVDVNELASKPFNFNVSLFQRLVDLQCPYSMLQTQRRMIPSIRQLIRSFYPELKDHETVLDPTKRPPIPGMGKASSWWFSHDFVDSRSSTMSYVNFDEAEIIVGFARYLVRNGVKPSEITILTYYNAQLEHIATAINEDKFLSSMNPKNEWSVRTVDGFQGEQNDVIILSLVRGQPATDRPTAGFVENVNRAVVALSRAKRGLYVFGNAKSLLLSSATSHDTWGSVHETFKQQGRIENYLPVSCKTHGNITPIHKAADWASIIPGGCANICGLKLPCGHGCISLCHAKCKCAHLCEKNNQSLSQKSSQPKSHPASVTSYVSNDKLLQGDFRSLFGSPDGSIPQESLQTRGNDYLAQHSKEQHSMPSFVRGWSAQSIETNDMVLEQHRRKKSSSQGSSVHIRETFKQITIDDKCQRVVDDSRPPNFKKTKVETNSLIDIDE
ncbi:unnamed protein product [Clonostachys solani]|uniref:Helicase required for RNAi-mediated heterochromatin assembly 1 n=1 Tax=Clonostachys solani TaxID=160281 RepID=A0A9N9YXL4_9HYPO|nr:unnamed protein product [Clonostachys solani]